MLRQYENPSEMLEIFCMSLCGSFLLVYSYEYSPRYTSVVRLFFLSLVILLLSYQINMQRLILCSEGLVLAWLL